MTTAPTADAIRAAKLSRVPGVTIAEARQRFGVTAAAVARARKLPESHPTLAELALAAVTKNGTKTSGTLGDLTGVAGWIDYINHDGCTAEDVRALLASCPEVVITGTRWKLAAPWP
jgi:hypothetical protein